MLLRVYSDCAHRPHLAEAHAWIPRLSPRKETVALQMNVCMHTGALGSLSGTPARADGCVCGPRAARRHSLLGLRFWASQRLLENAFKRVVSYWQGAPTCVTSLCCPPVSP